MQHLTIYPTSIDERSIDTAVRTLQRGEVIIYPTDTLYALGCDALNQRAIERLCRIKGINPDKNLLSVVCADISQAADYARIDNRAFAIIKHYLPGPFTFILPASTKLPKVFKGRKTVGIRVPGCTIARAIASALGNPILTSSATTPDPDDIVSPEAVAMAYKADATLLVDGGEGGMEPSTIVDLTDPDSPEVIRQGAGIFEE
ncbi:MAG: L-threonylcarbamoyladenylate synthase [Muribaculaceae bacterium]|nr:L-threonylcarbamoyladenylate synthase [Muribaculaceae bacterium]